MKRLFLFLSFAFLFIAANAQIQPDYAALKTDKKEDFTEEVNKAALQAATSLLAMPLEKDNPQRVQAFTFLMRWMTNTPEYSFEIDETATKVSKDNNDLLVVYLAAMSKYGLENKDKATDKKLVKLSTIKEVLRYCKSQNVKLSGELKKMDKANESNELEKYLKL